MFVYPAELYLSQDNIAEAEACVHETSGIFPSSHQVAFMVGDNEHSSVHSHTPHTLSLSPYMSPPSPAMSRCGPDDESDLRFGPVSRLGAVPTYLLFYMVCQTLSPKLLGKLGNILSLTVEGFLVFRSP